MSPQAEPELTDDDFDLDLVLGELGAAGGTLLYLPTGREVPGETCDTHQGTCPDTCANTCPNTCARTCANTCARTCANTCHQTCANTCHHTCLEACGPTNAQTHCFTCRSGCQTP